MQKSDNTKNAVNAHRKVHSSTTLNRRYVKRPTLSQDAIITVKRSPKLRHFAKESLPVTLTGDKEQDDENNISVAQHPLQQNANQILRAKKIVTKPQAKSDLSAKEIKERAIRKAIASAGSIKSNQQKETKIKSKLHFGFGRVMLALSCAALAAFAIVYFVNVNMPDLSLRVAAMQTGINASYPSYVPRDYTASGISSEEGKIVLDFKHNSNGNSFTIVEEVSSWDSNALLTSYIKPEFGEDYITIREQGLTIYVSGSNAAWVNGGILYKINAQNGTLSNKQVRSIAVSL